MHFKQTIPSPPLQPFIKCYWLLADDSGIPNDFEKIIPDGSPELIIHLGLPFEERIDGKITQQDNTFLYGQLYSSIEIRPSTQPRVLGIKFQPFGFSAFTDIPQAELCGRKSLIKEVCPTFPIEEYLEKFQSAASIEALFLLVDQLMLHMLSLRNNEPEDKMVKMKAAVSAMQSSNGSMKIDEITRALNISRRELERKFNRYIGLAPKQLAKIFRLQFALQCESKAALLTHLALEAGYYDQAHFIREFSSIVNERPSDYFALQNELTEKFLLK